MFKKIWRSQLNWSTFKTQDIRQEQSVTRPNNKQGRRQDRIEIDSWVTSVEEQSIR